VDSGLVMTDAPTNPVTGERVLTERDSGKEYALVFTEEAILQIESALNAGAITIVHRGLQQATMLGELQVLVWAGVNASRKRLGATKLISMQRALTLIRNAGGITTVLPIVVEALIDCDVLGLKKTTDIEDGTADIDGDDHEDDEDPTHGDG